MSAISRGQRVKVRRRAKGMTQTELAKRAGVTQPTISDLELDNTKEVSASTILRVALALETNAHYLMTGRGDPDEMMPAGTAADMLEIFAELTPDNQRAALAAATALRDTQK